MAEIYIRENKSIKEALERFKRACEKAGMRVDCGKRNKKLRKKR